MRTVVPYPYHCLQPSHVSVVIWHLSLIYTTVWSSTRRRDVPLLFFPLHTDMPLFFHLPPTTSSSPP